MKLVVNFNVQNKHFVTASFNPILFSFDGRKMKYTLADINFVLNQPI